MGVQLIVSTMNRTKINELDLQNYREAGFDKITIINQTSKNIEFQIDGNAEMYSYKETGLSKSRNRGLELVVEDIFILTDDDVKYIKNIKSIIEKKHLEYSNDKILTFKICDSTGKEFNNYPLKSKEHTLKSLLKVSSIEITFKKLKMEVKYNENFGLGAKYPVGEENLFLVDCLKKKIKMSFIPEIIAIHPLESSGGILNENNLKSKKEVYKKIFGKNLYKIIAILFVLKKREKLKEIGILNALKIFLF